MASTAAASRARLNLIIAATASVVTLMSLLQTLVVPVMGDIAHQLNVDASLAGWVLTANLLAAAVFTPLLGRLGDALGKRPVLIVVLIVVAGGSLLAAVTSSLPILILARVLQGASYGLFPLAVGVLRDELPPKRLVPSMALVTSTIGVGGGLGLVLTGVLTADDGNYHSIFWLSFVAVVAVLALVIVVIPGRPPASPESSIDWWGAIVLGVALVLFLLPVSLGHDWGWLSARTIGCFAGAVVALLGFLTLERRTRVPLVSLELLRYRPIVALNIAAAFLGLAMFSGFLGVSGFVQQPVAGGYGFGESVLGTSLIYLMPGTILSILVAPIAGRMVQRLGGRIVLVASTVVGGLGFLVLALWNQFPWQVIVFGTVANTAASVAYAAIPALIVLTVPAAVTGVASGVNAIARTVGSSVASALTGALIATFFSAATGFTSQVAYTVIFLVGAGGFLLSAVVTMVIMPRRKIGLIEEVPAAPIPAGTAG